MIGRILLILFSSTAFFAFPAPAEDLKLKSGVRFEVKILERTDEYLRIESPGGSLIYYLDEIESIDRQEVRPAAAHKDSVPSKESKKDDSEVMPSDPKNLFRVKLSKLLIFTEYNDIESEEGEKLLADLMQFAKDHQDSVFAKDARFVVQYLLFRMGIDENHWEKSKQSEERVTNAIKAIERIAYEYPYDSLEEYTVKIISSVMPEEIISGPFVYYPFYLRGYGYEIVGDYRACIEEYTYIKDRLVPKKPGEAIFLQDVYLRLIKAYTMANRVPESRVIMREAIKKFPDTAFSRDLQKDLPDDNIFQRPPIKQ